MLRIWLHKTIVHPFILLFDCLSAKCVTQGTYRIFHHLKICLTFFGLLRGTQDEHGQQHQVGEGACDEGE